MWGGPTMLEDYGIVLYDMSFEGGGEWWEGDVVY